ncbi:MAG: hypothetical protein LBI87_12865 [Candidatus Accumulibacter sp.]|jgi:hypothetical protein|nr:hypothetical protein [Accumulibacter sp.]
MPEERKTKLTKTYDPKTKIGTLLFKKLGRTIAWQKNDFSKEIQETAFGLGMNTTLGNAAAGLTDSKEMYEAVMARLKQLKSGTWRSSSERGFDYDLAAEAIVYQIGGSTSVEEIRDQLVAMDKDELAAVRNNPEFISGVAQIKAKRAAEAASNTQFTSLADLF